MLKFLRAALAVATGLVLILFAIANRMAVTISLWPLPVTIDAPLYAVVLLALGLGVLIGGFVVGLRSFSRKREAARLRRRLADLEHHLEVRRRQEEEALAARPGPGTALSTELARS
jgi:uncharacterized integral membrane protein